MSDVSNTPIEQLLKFVAVRKINFTLNEKLARPSDGELIDTKITQNLGYNVDVNFVNLTMTFFIHYNDSLEQLASITVENIFEVANLESYVIDNVMHLPEQVLVPMVGNSIAHARAFFYQGLSGGPYQNIVIPLSDQRRITAILFPGSISLNENDIAFLQKVKEVNESGRKEKIKP